MAMTFCTHQYSTTIILQQLNFLAFTAFINATLNENPSKLCWLPNRSLWPDASAVSVRLQSIDRSSAGSAGDKHGRLCTLERHAGIHVEANQ
jgi:hypothetical protein|tara:strand:- start:610 stop:885 length:276 start_codon:yes stop_codon:yes gene_type:complete